MALFICIVIYNGKIAAVKNTRVFSVLEFDGDNTGRVFSVIVSILMGYLIQRLCNFEFDFFRSIIAIIVVDLQINIKIIANICLWGVSHHITPSTSHEIKAKSKIIPKQILGPFYNSNQVVFDWGTFFSGNIFKVVHIVSPYILFSRPDHLA